SRKLSTRAVNEFTDFDIRIKVSYRNGDPVPDWFGIINPVTEEAHNLLTDSSEGTLHAMIPVAGDFNVTVEVMSPSGIDGQVRFASLTKELNPITESTLPIRFYDQDDGDAGNDGLDPWGVSLTTAAYTDSTQIVEQTGAFTSVDTDAATADICPIYHYNFIYLSGATEGGFPAGLYRFTKVNDNQIQLAEALGADYTNVTSSTGPKQTITGGAFDNLGGETYYLSGNYTRSYAINFSSTGYHLIGYKNRPVITNDSPSRVISYGFGGGGSLSGFNFFGNLIIDGERTSACVAQSMSSSGAGTFRNLVHRVDFINSVSAGSSVDMLTTDTGEWTRTLTMLQCKFQQLISDRFEHTSAGNLAGTINFQVSATIDPSTPATGYLWYLDATGRILSDDDTVRHRIPYLSWSGDTFVLDSATTRDCPAGAYVVTGGPELYSYQVVHDVRNRDSDFGVVACDFETDCKDDTKDHHLYPTGYLDNLLVTLNNFGKGMGVSYAVNGNLKSQIEDLTHYNIAFTNNKLSKYMRMGVDCSITNTYSYPVEYAEGLLLADNYSNVMHCLYYGSNARTIRFARNSDIDTAGLHNEYTNWATVVLATAAATDSAEFHITADGNVVTDRQFIKADDGQTQFDVVDNDAQIDFDGVTMRIDSTAYADGVIDRNNLYAPANAAGYIALIDGAGYNITEFNTEVSGTNTSEASGPTLTEVFVGDFVAPDLADVADLTGWSALEEVSSIALEIDSNQVYNRGDISRRSNFAEAVITDDHHATVTAITTGASTRVYVLTRVNPALIGYEVSQFYAMEFDINTTAGTASVQAFRVNGATETPLGSAANLTGLTGTNILQMRAIGTTLEMYVNGDLAATTTDATYTTGKTGMRIIQLPSTTARISAFSCGNIT
ncbi:hypothetical protein, partial [Methylophaga sp. UBA5088]